MLKKILWLTGLILLVWFLQPILEVTLPFPTEGMVTGLLDLEEEGDRSILLLMRFTFWMLLIYLVIKLTGPILSFMMPWARRYSVTKPLRRLQGFCSELGLILLFSSLCHLLIIAPINASVIFNDLKKDAIYDLRLDYEDLTLKREEDYKELVKVATEGNNFIYSLANSINRQANTTRIIYIPESMDFIVPYINEPTQSKSKYNWNLQIPPKESSPKKIEYYPPKNKFIIPQRKTSESSKSQVALSDAFPTTKLLKYKALQASYKAASDRYVETCDQVLKIIGQEYNGLGTRNYFAEIDEEAVGFQDSLTHYTWKLVRSKPASLLIPSLFKNLTIALLFGVILYLIIRKLARTKLAALIEKVLRVIEQGRFGLGGSSRFAGVVEEWSNLFKNQKHGIFLGKSLFNPRLLLGIEDKRHMLTVAATRAGKGTTAIIPNLLLWEGSALVIDPKGTNAAVTAKRRREMGQNVHIIDPFNIVQGEKAKFNPLATLNPNSPFVREQINLISEALVVPDTEQKEKHWDDGARTIIAGLIAHLVSSDQAGTPSISKIRDLLNLPPKDQEELWLDMIMNDKAGNLAKDAGSRIMRGLGTNEMSSILSNADKHTEWLSSPTMIDCLSESTFNFAELKEAPTTIYLVLPPNKLVTYNRFLRLFINLALSEVSSGKRSETPVLMIMDEFLSLGRMEEVEKAFGLLAGYNLILWPIIQEIGKLKDTYKDSFNSFINNSRAIQTFGIYGDTAKFVSEFLGERRTKGLFRNDQRERVAKLRTANEVTIDVSVESNWQYVLRAGKPPLVLEKVPYYNHSMFTGMFDQDPDYTS